MRTAVITAMGLMLATAGFALAQTEAAKPEPVAEPAVVPTQPVESATAATLKTQATPPATNPPRDQSPKPRFSAPIDVPLSARASAENRAAREAEEQAAAEAEAQAAAERPTYFVGATVSRAHDRRFSFTVFRRLGPWAIQPRPCPAPAQPSHCTTGPSGPGTAPAMNTSAAAGK